MIDKLLGYNIYKYSQEIPPLERKVAVTLGDQIPIIGEKVFQHLIQHDDILRVKDLEIAEEPFSLKLFFEKCGFEKTVDIDYNNKATVNLDLGLPLPSHLSEIADFVYDGGVIEHIPDVYTGLRNSASLVRKGGIIMQANPCAVYYGSYYSLNPELFRDFFELNGFKTLDIFVYWYNKKSFLKKISLSRIFNSFERKKLRKEGKSAWYYAKNSDLLSTLKIERNPLSERFIKKMFQKGMPANMHVIYVGKREEIKTFEPPVPSYYPSISE